VPWAAAAAVGGALISSNASSQASKAQQSAADQANDLQRQQYADTIQRNQPFYGAGTDALAMLQQKLPGLNTGYDPQQLLNEPGYQFGLQQGQQALERSLAARGRGVSGAALKAAAEFGNNYATGQLNSAFQRDQQAKQQQFGQLQSLAGMGQAAANNTAFYGQQTANNAGNNMIGAGNSAAANNIAQGNIWSGLLNQGASMYGSGGGGMSSPAGSSFNAYDTGGYGMPSAGNGAGGTFRPSANYGEGLYMADGGPVRSEPKIGTRAPVRTGGGGGLSREAVLAALDAASAPPAATSQPTGIAGLPTNPLNTGGINTARVQAAGLAGGGAVRGPGGPRDDAVPIMGSNGEHMFDAESVTALGDGDNEKGQALLNEMRARIKAHAAANRKRKV